MLQLAISLCLAITPIAIQTEKPDAPTAEVVAETTTKLKDALAKGTLKEKARAIEACREVVHPDVIALVAKSVGSKERELQEAAIGTLRWMDHPNALKRLHKAYSHDKRLRKDPELFALLLKSIGQHASPTSVKLLGSDTFASKDEGVLKARILAFGNIRTNESLKELFGVLRKVGTVRKDGKPSTKGRGKVPGMHEFRMAFMVLTGADHGTSRDNWERWWNNNKRDFEVAEKLPPLPKATVAKWYRYWNIRQPMERRGRREDLGEGRR